MAETGWRFLAPPWAEALLARLHEDVAVLLTRELMALRLMTRQEAIAAAMERPVQQELRTAIRWRYRAAARTCWHSWAAGYAAGTADADLAIAAGLHGWRVGRRHRTEVHAALAARTRRWADVARALELSAVLSR